MGNKDEMVRSLASRLQVCSYDELRVVAQILAGIERGRADYGPLDLDKDDRDFDDEARQEIRDALFYLCCGEVAARQRRIDSIAAQLVVGS